MNCLFVNLFDFVVRANRNIPIGCLSLATIVNESGLHTAQAIDVEWLYISKELKISPNLQENISAISRKLLSYNPEFISLYTMCNTHHYALMIAKRIKEIAPSIVVALGGPQATITAASTLNKYKYIDFIGIGEGERNIIDILRRVESDEIYKAPGIAYRVGDLIKINSGRPYVENLDDLPKLDYNLLNFSPVNMEMQLDVGRGCCFQCIFCSTKTFWKQKFRIKSPQRIMDEIKDAVERYGTKYFNFEHDLFVLNKDIIVELCNMIRKSSLNIKWGCSSRIDTIDDDILSIMSQAGCKSIYFGIESGSQRIQKLIKKNLELDILTNLNKSLKKNKIIPNFSFIYGYPFENEDDLEATLEMIYSLSLEFKEQRFKKSSSYASVVQLHKLEYYPGTELSDMYFDLLQPLEIYREDDNFFVDKWNDSELREIITEKSIFTQYYEVKTSLNEKVKFLDIYVNNILPYILQYFSATFEVLLQYYGTHIKLYQMIACVFDCKEIFDEIFKMFEEHRTNRDNIEFTLKLLNMAMDRSHISDHCLAAYEIFSFEKEYYKYLHDFYNGDTIQYQYDYDVIEAKKSNGKCIIKECILVEFYEQNSRKLISYKRMKV